MSEEFTLSLAHAFRLTRYEDGPVPADRQMITGQRHFELQTQLLKCFLIVLVLRRFAGTRTRCHGFEIEIEIEIEYEYEYESRET